MELHPVTITLGIICFIFMVALVTAGMSCKIDIFYDVVPEYLLRLQDVSHKLKMC